MTPNRPDRWLALGYEAKVRPRPRDEPPEPEMDPRSLPDPPRLLSPRDLLRPLAGGGKRELTRENPTETLEVRRFTPSVPESRSGLESRPDPSEFDAVRKGTMGGRPLNPGDFSFFGWGAGGFVGLLGWGPFSNSSRSRGGDGFRHPTRVDRRLPFGCAAAGTTSGIRPWARRSSSRRARHR